MAKIYAYNNNTELDLPEKIGSTVVDYLVGKSVSEIQKSISSSATMFIVFTHIESADIIVPNQDDADTIQSILSMSKLAGAKIRVNPTSIWYSKKAKKNIIISDTFKASILELSGLLLTFVADTIAEERKSRKMYKVKNTRNSKVILTTPIYNNAKLKCDSTPCTVILDETGTTVYVSKYGKVAIPPKKEKMSDVLRDVLKPNKMNGIRVNM